MKQDANAMSLAVHNGHGGRIVAKLIAPTDHRGIDAAFDDLTARALAPNPFMHPAVVRALEPTYPAGSIITIAAHRDGISGDPLLGFWVLRVVRDPWSSGLNVLQAPLDAAFHTSSEPVLDRNYAGETLTAMLECIARAPGLPRLVRLPSWPNDLTIPASLGARLSTEDRWTRAMMVPLPDMDAETYMRTALGKRYRKRLAGERALQRQGELKMRSLRGAACAEGVEAFVALEAAGWKGRRGTALAQCAADRDRVARVVEGLSKRGEAVVDILAFDDRPIAIGLVLEAAGRSYFWKTTFDEAFGRHSPGVLLDIAVTRRLFAERSDPTLDSGMMGFTNPDDQIWAERRPYSRLLVDLGAGPAGTMVRAAEWGRQRLRVWGKQLRQRSAPRGTGGG